MICFFPFLCSESKCHSEGRGVYDRTSQQEFFMAKVTKGTLSLKCFLINFEVGGMGRIDFYFIFFFKFYFILFLNPVL